jgi:malonate decarboxylase beta subunit
VIETNRGVEEFDSADRALVWRTMGGKHRYLLGGADAFVADTAEAFRAATLAVLSQNAALTLDTLRREHLRLEGRLAQFGRHGEALDIWKALGIEDPAAVPEQTPEEFEQVAARKRIRAHDSR